MHYNVYRTPEEFLECQKRPLKAAKQRGLEAPEKLVHPLH